MNQEDEVLKVACPTCGAQPSEDCDSDGWWVPHITRRAAWQREKWGVNG